MTNLVLSTEYLSNPLGLDEPHPRFGWAVETARRNWRQSGYRIKVSSSLVHQNTGVFDLWDTGHVISAESQQIAYAGEPLESFGRYYWSVDLWTADGRTVCARKPAFFEMGPMRQSDWSGKWIGAGAHYRPTWSNLLRKEFTLPAPVKTARAYVCGVGLHELTLNGQKASDRVLDPAQTDYGERVFYIAHDVTSLLRSGSNAIGIMLGDGFYHQSRVLDPGGMVEGHSIYGRPTAILLLRVECEDGSVHTVQTDESWKSAYGPITQNNLFAGETYDARLEQPGWDQPGFDDRCWFAAEPERPPGGVLQSQTMEPIRRMQEIPAKALSQPQMGVYVFDFGENLSGWARLSVRAHAGAEITLRFAETVDASGMIDTDSCGTFFTRVIQTDRYICKGGGLEIYEPRFTYHGFRYVEMTNFPGEPAPETLMAIKVHTALAPAGHFECSNETLNTLHQMAVRTIANNLHGLPTDCPVREKCGWTGDAWIISDTVLFNFHSARFWTKFVEDIETSRRAYGTWMHVVPGRRTCLEAGPLWSLAQVLIPWNLYWFHGDRRILERHFDDIQAWIEHLVNRAGESLVIETPEVGDHAAPLRLLAPGTATAQFATAAFYFGAILASRIARTLGFASEAEKHEALACRIRQAHLARFYDAKRRSFGFQGLNSFALATGLAPEADRDAIAASIAQDIEANGNHLVVGAVGIRFIFEILQEFGYDEIISAVLDTDTYPSLTEHIRRGATTLWETWETDDSQNDCSQNHPFKGGFDHWLFANVLGIEPLEPGFARIRVKPSPSVFVKWARGHHDSPYGKIAVHWRISGSQFAIEVTIPANTRAEIHFPLEFSDLLAESGKPIAQDETINVRKNADSSGLVVEIGSGTYDFSAQSSSPSTVPTRATRANPGSSAVLPA